MIKDYFKIEKNPKKGLLALEWGMLGYMAITVIAMLFTYTKLVNPESMVWGRIRVLFITAAMWAVYRMIPCRITKMARILAQLSLLAWWYPDTYEINRMFPNLDHVFAQWEQSLFGFQPALVFAKNMPWVIVSELMDLGYVMYYPMMVIVAYYYFFCTDCLPTPGYTDGIFYHLVEDAKAAGERPTAAFPSSHVSISTVCMLLAWHSGNRKLTYTLLPFYIFLCLATVYIQAHYLIDALAGLVTGVAVYFGLMAVSRNMTEHNTSTAKLSQR